MIRTTSKNRLLSSAVLSLLLHGLGAFAQGTFEPVRITFDNPPVRPPGTGLALSQYTESNVLFTPINSEDHFGRRWAGDPRDPDDGTPAYLQAALSYTLMFGLANGGVFDLVSVDLAEYSTVVPDAVMVPFIAYYPDGSSVVTSFVTDGIIDGPIGKKDFQTFQFGSEFSGLVRVEIPTSGWSLDNVVMVIPEPSCGALCLLTFGSWWARRWRERRWRWSPTRAPMPNSSGYAWP